MNLGLNLGLGGRRSASSAPAITGFIGASSASVASGTSITVAVPSGAQSGDILVMFGVSSAGGNEQNIPAGWAGHLTAVGYALRSLPSYDGTTPDYTFTTTTGTAQAIILAAFRGYDFGASTNVSSAVADPTPPNLTVPAANSIVLQIAGSVTAGHSYSMAAGWTSRAAISTSRSISAFQRDALAPSGVLASTIMTRTAGASTARALAFSLSPKP